MKGLLALLGKPSASDDSASTPDKGGAERAAAKEAFSALQDGDEEGFVEAFIDAVKACVKKSKGGGYAAPEVESDDEEEV